MFDSLDIPVRISVTTMAIELFIFLGAVYLMERMVFTPIRSAWAERDRLIQEGLAASTEGRDEAAQARDEVQRILASARRRAQGEIDQATAQGSAQRDSLVARATEEFRRLLDVARVEISSERERAALGLQGRIVDLALLAAAHVTGESYAQPQVRELAAAVVQREGLR
jgi:ATP synthase F0 subunit b